ncbi:MAG: AraC family transcriptional regulator [Marinibacterium sp.]|nr:AraC family transcriptional regulator [Marinibacterium sp.]
MTPRYEDRLRRVIRYMHANPGGDLSLDRLADEAAMSRFHWHRVFRALTGETCAQAARRVRLFRAGVLLVQSDLPVDQVAALVGYDNPQSFARAFRDYHGVTPLAFRAAGSPGRAPISIRPKGHAMFTVTIRDQAPMHLAALTHTGPYTEIGQAFEELSAIFSARNLWPHARGMVGIYYDDPDTVAAADLRSAAAVVVAPGFEMPDNLTPLDLPGGPHAVLPFQGPYAGLHEAYGYLYGSWLSGSGREPADAPSYEIYLNSPMDTAPADLRTEICLPLRA